MRSTRAARRRRRSSRSSSPAAAAAAELTYAPAAEAEAELDRGGVLRVLAPVRIAAEVVDDGDLRAEEMVVGRAHPERAELESRLRRESVKRSAGVLHGRRAAAVGLLAVDRITP